MKEEAVEVQHKEKTIKVIVTFWTDGIAEDENKRYPKHAWTGGNVRFNKNKSHQIEPTKDPIIFNSLMELPSAIEKLLIQHGIQLHLNDKTKKYHITE